MIGSFRRRGCTCKKKRCTCGSKWTYRYHIIDPKTGKRKQKETRGFSTKEEAEAEAKRILVQMETGSFIEEKDYLFADFAKEWILEYERSGKVKPSTVGIRKDKIKYLLNYFGQIKIRDISKLMYQQFLNSLTDKLARKTVSGAHEVGQLIFKRAVELEILAKDITESASVPIKKQTVKDLEEHEEIPKYLEKEELIRFLDISRDSSKPIDFPIFVTLSYTGLRVGELCALKWRDVDTKENTISITKTLYNPKYKLGEYELLTPKTKSSHRKIDVDKYVIDILGEHKSTQGRSSEDHEEDFVFNRSGFPISTLYIWKRMRVLLISAGIKYNLTPHSLRHTHTSLLAEAGVSLSVIQNRLGHQDDKITRRIYLHVTKPKKKEASQKFAELMRGN